MSVNDRYDTSEYGPTFNSLKPAVRYKILPDIKLTDRSLFEINVKVHVAGGALARIKASVPHGKFKPMIKEIWGRRLPYSTAWNYMSIYQKFDLETIDLFPITVLMDLRKLPDDIVSIVKDYPERFADHREEILSLARAYKKEEITLDQFIDRVRPFMVGVQEALLGETEGRREAVRREIRNDFLRELSRMAERFAEKVEQLKGVLTPEEVESLEITQTPKETVRVKVIRNPLEKSNN